MGEKIIQAVWICFLYLACLYYHMVISDQACAAKSHDLIIPPVFQRLQSIQPKLSLDIY